MCCFSVIRNHLWLESLRVGGHSLVASAGLHLDLIRPLFSENVVAPTLT